MNPIADAHLDLALRSAARQRAEHEAHVARTDDAWTQFARERLGSPRVAARVTPPLAHRRRRVVVGAAILVAATVAALVVLPRRHSSDPPPDDTSPPTTSAPPPTLRLPVFPDGRGLASLSAVSDAEWYALSESALLWHTDDAGVTWTDVPLFGEKRGAAQFVHFADSSNGWLAATNCCLYSTHDAGATWTLVPDVQPVLEEGSAVAITSAGGRVYLLADVLVDGNSRIGVKSALVDSDDFTWTGSAMGDARWALSPDSNQLVVSEGGGWAIAYGVPPAGSGGTSGDEVPHGAVRSVDGEWVPWEVPCAMSLADERMYSTISVPRMVLGVARAGDRVALACSEPDVDAPPRTFMSADGGDTFVETSALPDGTVLTDRSWSVVLDDGTVLLGTTLASGELGVLRSSDGGVSWAVDTSFGGEGRFTSVNLTPSGRVVAVGAVTPSSGPPEIVGQTRDAAGTWSALLP